MDCSPSLFYFEDEASAQEAASRLRGLGRAAQTLMATCVAEQALVRRALSPAAAALEGEGFVFVRNTGSVFYTEFTLSPTLAGEEALEWLEAEVPQRSRGKAPRQAS